jgi:hypothetical protein
MVCAVCGSRQIGKIGADQYFCWDCYVEFNSGSNQVKVYDLEEDGTLVMHDFQEECVIQQAT